MVVTLWIVLLFFMQCSVECIMACISVQVLGIMKWYNVPYSAFFVVKFRSVIHVLYNVCSNISTITA